MSSDKKQPSSKHWIFQRGSAGMLIPLALWFVIDFSQLIRKPYSEVQEWFSSLWHIFGLSLLLSLLFYHGALGLQVVWEDYISDINCRKKLICITNILSWMGSILAICACLFVYIKG